MDDTAVLDLIFRPGFSTAARVTDVSGRGVGMDVVRDADRAAVGLDRAALAAGRTAPPSRSSCRSRSPSCRCCWCASPARTTRCRSTSWCARSRVAPDDVHRVYDREVLFVDDEQIPLIWTAEALELGGARRAGRSRRRAASGRWCSSTPPGETYALAVERLLGKREIVLKSLGALLAAGAVRRRRHAHRRARRRHPRRRAGGAARAWRDAGRAPRRGRQPPRRRPSAPRRAAPAAHPRWPRTPTSCASSCERVLEAHGYEVVAARDGAEALELADARPARLRPGLDRRHDAQPRRLRADPRAARPAAPPRRADHHGDLARASTSTACAASTPASTTT